MTNVIEIEGLSARYGRRTVLEELCLQVRAGSVTALLGSNAAGKTTLLRVLTGQLRARGASVRVLGLDPWRQRRALMQRVGFVPERTDLARWMRIEDHLRLVAAFHASWDAAEARRLLELFELDPRSRYAELSKGQRALENLTCALAHRPALLLLDEPFSGLDVRARRRVFEGVLEHLREEGRSVLLVSHSIDDVLRCADRVALMEAGRILLECELEDLLHRDPQEAAAARLALDEVPRELEAVLAAAAERGAQR